MKPILEELERRREQARQGGGERDLEQFAEQLVKDGVLTLESQSADRDELVRAAETLIAQMEAEDAAK